MIVCQACISGTAATLYAVVPLGKEEPEVTYTLLFHDLPTGAKEELVYTGECAAIYAFAAWLAADEAELGTLTPFRRDLYARLKTKDKFLP